MLSTNEKIAGRQFRDECQARLYRICTADPPQHVVPNVLAVLRHACPARAGRSSSLELKETYWPSPAYTINGDTIAAGRFAFIFRDGRCRGCQQTARSPAGRLVEGHRRAPLDGRAH